jgi:hypothetical protein
MKKAEALAIVEKEIKAVSDLPPSLAKARTLCSLITLATALKRKKQEKTKPWKPPKIRPSST